MAKASKDFPMNVKALLLTTSLMVAACCEAATLELSATTTSIQHFFSPGGGYENLLGEYYGGTMVPSTSAKFSDYERMRITLSAPAGFQFAADPSTEARSVALHVGLFYNNRSGPSTVLPTSVELIGYNGPLYGNTIEVRAFNGGQQFYVEGWLDWSGWGGPVPGFTFESLVIEADLSGMADRSSELVSYHPSFGSAIGILTYTPLDMKLDPGPMVRLEPIASIPEPDSSALIIAGIAVLAFASTWRPRRHAADI